MILGILFGAAEALIIAFVALSPTGALHKMSSAIHTLADTNPAIGSVIDQAQTYALHMVASLQDLHL